MPDYMKMYYKMVDGAERAISAIEANNYGLAKDYLIQAEQFAEDLYIETAEENELDAHELNNKAELQQD